MKFAAIVDPGDASLAVDEHTHRCKALERRADSKSPRRSPGIVVSHGEFETIFARRAPDALKIARRFALWMVHGDDDRRWYGTSPAGYRRELKARARGE